MTLDCIAYLEIQGIQPSLVRKHLYAQFLCPLQYETVPSFTVYFSDDHWYCYSCHRGGDLIGLIARLEFGTAQITHEVYQRAEALNGGTPMGNTSPLSSRRTEERRESPPASTEQQQMLTALAEWWHWSLHTTTREESRMALAYVHSRGVADETCGRDAPTPSIGFAPPDTSYWIGELSTFLAARFGATWTELARSVGLLHGDGSLRLKNRIMFSCFRENGHSWFYQGRSLFEKSYLNPQGLRRYPFTLPIESPQLPGTALVEGAWEVAVLHRYGLLKTIGTLGPDLRLAYAGMEEPIYLLQDGDEGGDRQADRIQQELHHHGREGVRVRPPADIDEWVTHEGITPLYQALQDCTEQRTFSLSMV